MGKKVARKWRYFQPYASNSGTKRSTKVEIKLLSLYQQKFIGTDPIKFEGTSTTVNG